MKITIIGTGFVGVVSAAVYASFGHQVTGLDVDKNKIQSLSKSKVPFFEPNLETLLKEQQKLKRLTFTSDYQTAIKNADLIIIAVGTPAAIDGQADLKYVDASCQSLAPYLKDDAIVAIKSTVPPGTLNRVKKIIQTLTQVNFYTASLPEFLKEGSAVHDTLNPDRIIIGVDNDQVFSTLKNLHQAFNAPIIQMKPESAQMAKYAANSYLATRITFINQIADLCEKNGADIQEVIQGIGSDQRIGNHYWYPGLGYGGSCFPKDVKELAAYSRAVGESDNLLNKVNNLNEERIPKLLSQFATQINGWENKTVAILGLAFKPNTDDMREAPSTKIIPLLLNQVKKIQSFDPMAKWQTIDAKTHPQHQQMTSIAQACDQADVIMVLIEWPEIISYDYAQLRQAIKTTAKQSKKQYFIDTRNQFDPKLIKQAGYHYIGIGRN